MSWPPSSSRCAALRTSRKTFNYRMAVPAHEDGSHDRTEELAQKKKGLAASLVRKKQHEDDVGMVNTSACRGGSRRLTASSLFSMRWVVLIHYTFMKKGEMRLQLARRVTRHDHGPLVALICGLHSAFRMEVGARRWQGAKNACWADGWRREGGLKGAQCTRRRVGQKLRTEHTPDGFNGLVITHEHSH